MGLPGWPGGDPDKIKEAAGAWKALATSLDQVVETAEPSMTAMFDDWKGDAATSFETTWNKFSETHKNAAKGAEGVAKALEEFADKLEEAHKKYEHMVEAMAATAVVGIGLAIFTGGLSAAAGAAAESAVAAEVTSLLVELGVELETVASMATAAAEAIGGAVESAVGLAVDFSIGFVMSAGNQALESGLDGEGVQVKWDQALLAGLTSAALGPLMRGKSLPVRIAIGAGGTAASGALSQLDNLLLHGGLDKGESFDVKSLLVDLVAGGVMGRYTEGPASESEIAQLSKMVDGLADDPALASLLARDPGWVEVYATNPDILRLVSTTERAGAIAVTPQGVATMMAEVRASVISIKAPESLAKYTSEEMLAKFQEKTIDVSKESIKKTMEIEVEEAGGPDAVAKMSPAELQGLAQRIVASVPMPDAPVPAGASAR